MQRAYQALEQCRLMDGIPLSEKPTILDSIRSVTRSHAAGDMLIQAGDPCDYLVLVVSGLMKAEMIDSDGHVVRITDLRPPAILAPAFLFGEKRRYPVNVTAAVAGSTLWIARDELLGLLQRDRRVLGNFLSILSNQGQFLAQKVHFHAFNTLREKVLQYLGDLAAEQGGARVVLPVSRGELADFFGVARPSLSRVLSGLASEGLIRVSGKTVILSAGLYKGQDDR